MLDPCVETLPALVRYNAVAVDVAAEESRMSKQPNSAEESIHKLTIDRFWNSHQPVSAGKLPAERHL